MKKSRLAPFIVGNVGFAVVWSLYRITIDRCYSNS